MFPFIMFLFQMFHGSEQKSVASEATDSSSSVRGDNYSLNCWIDGKWRENLLVFFSSYHKWGKKCKSCAEDGWHRLKGHAVI